MEPGRSDAKEELKNIQRSGSEHANIALRAAWQSEPEGRQGNRVEFGTFGPSDVVGR